MSITYPPEMLPMPEAGDDVEIIVVDGADPLTAEELACGLGIRRAYFDGVLFFRTITKEELFVGFPDKSTEA